ncbi:hypothetical protein E2C01_065513 [Portunus trituberculatus]|uniref:Uncharacterized protein n=1 Tax=Portunus trituberculatus TaxID=210409 RepID=A0A5B7HES7_PORTR|nr:hypothetical protein [Portunus trituberculatus]
MSVSKNKDFKWRNKRLTTTHTQPKSWPEANVRMWRGRSCGLVGATRQGSPPPVASLSLILTTTRRPPIRQPSHNLSKPPTSQPRLEVLLCTQPPPRLCSPHLAMNHPTNTQCHLPSNHSASPAPDSRHLHAAFHSPLPLYKVPLSLAPADSSTV